MRFVSIDRNWTVFWRKLIGLLKETGLLLTETSCLLMVTGRSNDCNWTDYCRKLHVLLKERGRLLTETGWAIDGNWTVYWWKEWSMDGSSPADFLHFGGLKNRFCRVPKPAVSWTPSILELIFIHFVGWKFDFCRVVKHRVQDYQASFEQIVRILASWKCDFWWFVKPSFLVPRNELKFT